MKTTLKLEHEIRASKDPAVLTGADFDAPALCEYLRQLLEERHVSTGEIIQRCNLDRGYGYQLFNGTRRPTRDMLIIIGFQLSLDEKKLQRLLKIAEAQRLLKLAGRPVLYARNRRDAAILFALNKRLTLPQTEELLAQLEEASLGSAS